MRITFLGTGTSQGVPVIACKCPVCLSNDKKDIRLRSSVLIEIDGNTFVIDTGPDFRYQMLRANVNVLDAVLITHGHKDHIGGLDDVRAFNYILKKPIDVYASKFDQDSIKREFYYAFAKFKYPGVPVINLHTINNKPFIIKNTKIIPIETLHYHVNVYGFRIGDFTYLTDANFISEKEKQKIKGSKILVVNALRRKKHISHFTLDEAIALINEIKPEKGYLTHISHLMGLHEDVEKELPENIKIAYDGLELTL